ncbi:hypothetical protein KDAU_09210 [Dictyobacter aurantiacus]|uniref:Uncharacterized protein n=1 Tax=Dictyobacter aurantiacus TaxID=1936993 RepID=A0A401Z9S7_9CHLR|nr:hypothetical protein KDAU_09210 [Dictyobacter aurantiacus]
MLKERRPPVPGVIHFVVDTTVFVVDMTVFVADTTGPDGFGGAFTRLAA